MGNYFSSVLEAVTFSLAILAGIVSVLLTMISTFVLRWSLRKRLAVVDDEKFNEVIRSDNPFVINSYLRNTIGSFTVYEYVTSDSVSRKLDTLVTQLERYILTDSEMQRQKNEVKQKPPPVKKGKLEIAELKKVINDLRYGEKWAGLTRLRRYIEQQMKFQLTSPLAAGFTQLANTEQMMKKQARIDRLTAGKLLDEVMKTKIISKDTFEHLMYAILVCNKGIHGETVSDDEAESAVYHADIGLRGFPEL